MNDDLDLRNRANQGNKAKNLLNDTTFKRIFEILEMIQFILSDKYMDGPG